MRTLITGGAGFIGSHLCERFLAEGHEVVCVDNCITGATPNIDHLRKSDRFSFIRHDISHALEIDGPIDNILRPILIRKGADLPMLLIFAGVIGGLIAFGIIGLFVGPVVLAVTYTLLKEWMAEQDNA